MAWGERVRAWEPAGSAAEEVDVEKEVARGDAAMEDKNYAEALNIYGTLEGRHSQGSASASLLARMGRCYLALGEMNRALHVSTSLLRRDASDVEALLLRAETQFQAIPHHIDNLAWDHDAEISAKCARQAVSLDPDHRGAARLCKLLKGFRDLVRQVRDASQAGNFALMKDCLSAVLDVESNHSHESSDWRTTASGRFAARCYTERGRARLQLGDCAGCVDDCAIALSLDATLPEAPLKQADALQQLERWAEAAQVLEDLYAWHKSEDIFWKMEWAKFEVRRVRRPDYYGILGLEADCTASAVKKQYLRMSSEHHPDKLKQKTGGLDIATADEAFKHIGEAYEILGDPAKRDLYDRGYDAQGIREVLAVRKRFAGQAPCSQCGEDESGKFGADQKWYCLRCWEYQRVNRPKESEPVPQPPNDNCHTKPQAAPDPSVTDGESVAAPVRSEMPPSSHAQSEPFRWSFSLAGAALGFEGYGLGSGLEISPDRSKERKPIQSVPTTFEVVD